MKIEDISDIYHLIYSGSEKIPSRKGSLMLRRAGLKSCRDGFTKLAFDTRRIDQETEFNPRRGLQNYNRSEAFLSQAVAQKITSLAKLQNVLELLRNKYGREHEWQDSNARVLLSTLNNGLRTNQQDGDFSISQPAQGSLDYIEELLHVRYRLAMDDLVKLGEEDLKKIILSKDEDLIHKDVHDALAITKSDIASQPYDTLMEKLFGGIKASKENPEVERTITITIKDKIRE